jgi:hypothetical protein
MIHTGLFPYLLARVDPRRAARREQAHRLLDRHRTSM